VRSLLRKFTTLAWWIVLLRGVIALLLGTYAMWRPAATLVALVTVMAVFWLVDGVFLLVAALSGRTANKKWWVVLLRAIIGILAGLAVLGRPLVATLFVEWVLVYVLAFLCLFSGTLEIITAIRLRKEIDHEWSFIIGGVLYIAFGLLLLHAPLLSAFVLTQFVGFLAGVLGLLLILFSFRLRETSSE